MDTVHECDRQTDGRTDGRTDRITITDTVQRIASHGNKMLVRDISFLFQRVISEIPRPITVKLCHMIGNWSYFIIQLPKFGGLSPQKYGGQNMQNFGPFCSTSDFDREYLRNGLRYPKSESKFFQFDSSCVLRKKSRELWSTNYRDLDVSLDPLKCTYLGYYISALWGCCALKFLHALEIDQALVAHTQRRRGVPPKIVILKI